MTEPARPARTAQAIILATAAVVLLAVGLGVALVAGDNWLPVGWPLLWYYGLPAVLLIAGAVLLALRGTAVVLIVGAVSLALPLIVLCILTAAHALNGRAAGFLTGLLAIAHAVLLVWIIRLCRPSADSS